MKIQITSINYYERPVKEFGYEEFTGFIGYDYTANCTVYLDSGDKFDYKVKINSKKFDELRDIIKDQVIENIGKINA